MEFLKRKILSSLIHWHTTGMLHVVYALCTETLLIGYFSFIGLFTIETLLPTFITLRMSLTLFFFFLLIATFLLSLLGRFLSLSFSWSMTRKSPLLWLGILWAIGILVVSLIKFPLPLIPLLISGFLLVGYLFWHIFFGEEE